MGKAFLNFNTKELTFCKNEAINLSEGTPIIEGTFRPTHGTWTGIFESIDGQVYEIEDGIIKEAAA